MCQPLHLAVVLVLGVVVAVLGVIEAATRAATLCPEPKTKDDFIVDNFLGTWYEMKRTPWGFDVEDEGECGTVRYSWVKPDKKDELKVENIYFLPQNSTVSVVMMSAVPSDISSGKFTATFPTRIYEKPYRPFRYWVLGTDYVSFAVMFSCQEPEGSIVPIINLWVLSMVPHMYNAEVDAKAIAVIKAAGLDPSILRPVQHQDGCPSIQRCQECNKPVLEFDLDRFAGPWWNVQHGPYAEDSDRQSCRVTEIAATGRNTIKLVNSVMIKKDAFKPGNEHAWQTSESQWRGSDRRDGSFGNDLGAKMCVLATDYDNWAVLSVCAARDEGDGFPVLPFGARWVVKPGGVYVLARNRGLTPEQQAHANKAVAKAGIPPSYMQATPSTPCPEVLLPATAGAANKTPAILLLFGLATVLGPAQ